VNATPLSTPTHSNNNYIRPSPATAHKNNTTVEKKKETTTTATVDPKALVKVCFILVSKRTFIVCDHSLIRFFSLFALFCFVFSSSL
jgi:hypothetical protein